MTPREQLTDWVKQKHRGQLIRHTDEPYFNHLIFVAETAGNAAALGCETGLCHDLLEDTGTDAAELEAALQSFGYNQTDAQQITACVVELTDVFTRKAYPGLDKKTRKKKEAARLATISPIAQTVKYADLIYNANWVLKYDRKKAVRYLRKKQLLLAAMNKGDGELHFRAVGFIDRKLDKLIV